MNEKFEGLKLFTEKEQQELLKNAIIVLDTNILLNFYRVSKKTSDDIIKALNNYAKNIWLPYYVGVEFYKNKYNVSKMVMDDNSSVKSNIISGFDKMIEAISRTFKEYKNDEEVKKIVDLLKNDKDDSLKELENLTKDVNKTIESNIESLDKKISDLVGNKITDKVTEEEFILILKEGHNRLEKQIPPGYKDNKKDEWIGEYKVNGDYFIFEDIIRLSISKERDIVFITDDSKEDWYDKKEQRIKYDLQKEFFYKTGRSILLLSSSDFIDLHNKVSKGRKVKVSTESKKEIKKLNDLTNLISTYNDIYNINNLINNFNEINNINNLVKYYSDSSAFKSYYVNSLPETLKEVSPILNNLDISGIKKTLEIYKDNLGVNAEFINLKNQLNSLNSTLNSFSAIHKTDEGDEN